MRTMVKFIPTKGYVVVVVVTDLLTAYVYSPHAWWTGYFTSRPQLKSYTRSRERLMRTAELFWTFGQNMGLFNGLINKTEAMNNITYLRHAIDVSQHHDGITGTETQHTTVCITLRVF